MKQKLSIAALLFLCTTFSVSAQFESIIWCIVQCPGGTTAGPNCTCVASDPTLPLPSMPSFAEWWSAYQLIHGYDWGGGFLPPGTAVPWGQPVVFPPTDTYDPANDAFTMLGDSRTHFGGGLWEQPAFLGGQRSGATPKTGVHNGGMAGSTAQWLVDCLTFRAFDGCKMENMSSRITLMIGGNDLQHAWPRWAQWGPLLPLREMYKNQQLDAIHDRVKRIVNLLVLNGKEVIVQTHYNVRPSDVPSDPLTRWTDKHYAFNEGLRGLSDRIEYDYPDFQVYTWWNPLPSCKIKGYSICWKWCFFGCYKACISIPQLVCTGGKQHWGYRGVPGVTKVHIGFNFGNAGFLDGVHAGVLGLYWHSVYLNSELRRRGWW